MCDCCANKKVVEVRRVITGYANHKIDFDPEIRDKTIVYSSIIHREQDIDKVINDFKLY